MSRAEHDARNLAQVEMLWAEVDSGALGSGWHPTVWCHTPGCAAPIPAEALVCAECGAPAPGHGSTVSRRDLVIKTKYRPAEAVADLHAQGHGEIQALRHGHPDMIRLFDLPRCGCGELMDCGDLMCADCEARR